MDQTSTAVIAQQINKGRKQTKDNNKRAGKRKMINQEPNENQDKKKYKNVERNENEYNIPRRDPSLPERNLQLGPSRPREYQWPIEYPTWSRGRREYRGYQGNYGDQRGQSRGCRLFRRNGPRDFFRGQSRQWSPKPDYPPSEHQIQKVLSYIKKNEVNSKTSRDNPPHQQSY